MKSRLGQREIGNAIIEITRNAEIEADPHRKPCKHVFISEGGSLRLPYALNVYDQDYHCAASLCMECCDECWDEVVDEEIDLNLDRVHRV